MYGLIIESNSGVSQYRQLYEQLRKQIMIGAISPTSKLSSTRQIATELKISRSIVLEVIDQLKVEGFLETRHGSGTYIAPNSFLRKGFEVNKGKKTELIKDRIAEKNTLSFIAGMPDLSLFPRRAWNHAYTQAIEYAETDDFGYNHPKGHYDLRLALCNYLYRTKGIKTKSSNIFLTAGSAQALSIVTELRKNPSIILEDPSAGFVHDIFQAKKCRITFAEMDDEGIIPENISTTDQDFIYLSPSHQYPLGGTLSAGRRIEILKKANQTGTYIIEDDYDGEYRFNSRPIAPLQVLAPDQVIYIGTFSKILSPALRLGYMVVPDKLIKPLKQIKQRWDLLNEGLNQMAMARFINEDHIYRHLRKSLKFYKSRKTAVEEAVFEILGDKWEISGNTTGLHLILRLEGTDFSNGFREKMRDKGILFEPVNTYSHQTGKHKDKLVLGYGHRSIEEIKTGLMILRTLLL